MNIFYSIEKDLQYYPTPEKLIEDILFDIEIKKDHILFLEPSAGDGVICRHIKTQYKNNNIQIHCIEKDKVLINSLKGQGFNVIHNDFDTFQAIPMYDLITMNPPFKKGVKHVLKAYNCLNGGGKLIAIINAESIKNDYSKDRKILKNLIDKVGEYKLLKGSFKNAENKTNVEIAVIYLKKPIYENEFDFFGNVKKEIKTVEELNREKYKSQIESTALMSFDSIDSAINMYRTSTEKLFKIVDIIDNTFNTFDYLKKECEVFKINPKEFLNYFIDNTSIESKEYITENMRQIIWAYIFEQTDCKKYIYSKDKSNFYSELKNGSVNIAFTRENILAFLKDVFFKRTEYFKSGVESLFEEITSKYNGNPYYNEGWKTNKNWKINKKIIMPWGIRFNSRRHYNPPYKMYGDYSEILNDWVNDLDRLVRQIDKNLNNYNVEDGYIKEILHRKFKHLGYIESGDKYDNTAETPYFELKFWKKGTLHIKFKDEKILEEMNIIGAKLRKDLGYDNNI